MRVTALIGTILALSACGTESNNAQSFLQILAPGQPSGPSERFAAMTGSTAPLLQVGIEEAGTATYALLEVSRDGVDSFITPDDVALILERGMLRGTRGLAQAMLASDISASLQAVLSVQPGEVTRFHTFLDGENNAVTRSYVCQIAVAGPRNIAIGSVSIDTELMTEECRNAEQNFTNVYWVQTAPPRIVQSRQWAGDFNGMLVMRDVDR